VGADLKNNVQAEIETWAAALEAYDTQDYDRALRCVSFFFYFEAYSNAIPRLLRAIADSSKILFNIGLIHATLGSHETAVDYFHQVGSGVRHSLLQVY
jgi:hypothetical protein